MTPTFSPAKLRHSASMQSLQLICFIPTSYPWVFLSVSQALRENTYPFLAMIMLKDRRMTVVGRLEGLIQPDDLINQLTFIMDANQTYLVSERLERYQGVPF